MTKTILRKLPFLLVTALLSLLTQASLAQPYPWHSDVQTQCLTFPYDQIDTEPKQQMDTVLQDLRDVLPAIPDLLDILGKSKTTLCIDPEPIEERGYLDVDLNLIGLRSDLSKDAMVIILVHEMRHLEQLDRGYCPSTDLAMGENARATYAIEADAMAMTSLVTWVMRDRGNAGPWDTLNLMENYADIPRSFAEEMQVSHDLGLAASAAFKQWFMSRWRTDSYYLASCSDYLDRLDSTKLLPGYGVLPDDFLDDLCILPSGRSYECQN